MCMMVIDELHRIHWPFYKVSQWNYTLVIVQPMRFNMTAAAVIFIEVHLKSVILETTPFFVIRNQMSLFYIEVNEFKKGANTWFSLVTRIFFFFFLKHNGGQQTNMALDAADYQRAEEDLFFSSSSTGCSSSSAVISELHESNNRCCSDPWSSHTAV